MLRRLLLAAVALLPLAAPACSKKPADSPVGLSSTRTPPAGSIDLGASLPYTPLSAALLAKLPEGVFGPYLAARDTGGMAVLAAPADGEPLVWMSAPLGDNGAPKSPLSRIGPAPKGIVSTTLRPLGASGYLLVWSRASDRGQVVEAVALGDDGVARGASQTIYQGADAVLWADVVTTNGGAHVYVTTANGKEGRVQVAAVDEKGVPRSGLQIVAPSALAWQPVRSGAGSLLATVQTKDTTSTFGRVLATPVSDMGKPGPTEIVAPAGADLDLDAVAVDARTVLAWTDHSGTDGRVRVVAVDPQGKPLGAPRMPLMSAGDQALVSLAVSTGSDPSLLVAWEDLASRGLGKRRVQLSALAADVTTMRGRAMLELATKDEGVPSIAGAEGGFATLSLAKACLGDAPTCDGARIVPTFVRFGNDLSIKSTSPVLLEQMRGEPPELVWGLSCTARGCFTLATDVGTPTSAYIASLDVAKPAWRAPATRSADASALALMSVTTSLRGPRFAQIAAARVGATEVVATLTDHAEGTPPPPLPADVDARGEAEKDRMVQKDPKRATARGAILSLTSSDAKSEPKTTTISVRALSQGGVAVAPDALGKEACVAWVARDAGDPEVFLTRIGEGGKKLGQQMLTHAKGDVTDVAIVAAEDGWLVAWVDSRDGDGEVYAARVDHALRKKGPEQRITKAKGDASEIALLVSGKEARIAFVDPRAGDKESAADVFVARVKTADATKIAEEARISSGQRNPRALRMVPSTDGALLVWVDAEAGVGTGGTMQTVLLDGAGVPRGLPSALSLGDLSPTSIALQCEKDACRLIAIHGDGDSTAVAAATFRQGETPAPRDLLTLFARPGADVSPTFAGDALYVADDSGNREGRLRRLAIRWP